MTANEILETKGRPSSEEKGEKSNLLEAIVVASLLQRVVDKCEFALQLRRQIPRSSHQLQHNRARGKTSGEKRQVTSTAF